MPIYEYRCGGCGQVFEYMQRMSEDPKTTCENCGGSLERLISASAFHLKGGGWYKDLYASSKGDSVKSDGASDAASKSDAGGGGDKAAASSSSDSGGSSSSDGGSSGSSSSSSSSTSSSSSSSSGGSDS